MLAEARPAAAICAKIGPDGDQAAAWAAALVLIAFVLVMNILAKLFAGRKRRQLEGS